MCGPIAFVLPVDRNNKPKMVLQTMLYHIGRLFSYSLIGFVFGILGKGLFLAGFQQRLSIVIGVLMIVIVLIPVQLFNKYNFSKPLYKIVGIVKTNLGFYLKRKTNSTFFSIGFFNGFLPCGLVYMALMGAIAGSGAINGALYMLLFGLGTVPMMSVAVFFGNFIKVSLRNKIQKVIPVFVIIIGFLFILRGLGLGIPYISPSDAKLQISNNAAACE